RLQRTLSCLRRYRRLGAPTIRNANLPVCSMKTCSFCGQELPESSRFCTSCGRAVAGSAQTDRVAIPPRPERPDAEEMNLSVLYVMVGLLILAVLFPPWETPPGQSPEFLGFHF